MFQINTDFSVFGDGEQTRSFMYIDDCIKGTMKVRTLDRTMSTTNTYEITYNEVYPKTVNSIEMNHSTQNATVRLGVEMAYSYWTTNRL